MCGVQCGVEAGRAPGVIESLHSVMPSTKRVTAKRFCSCVKKVKASKKPKTEGSSIAICTSSLLWPHGRTLHSVSCRRKNHLKTQKRSAAMRKK